MGLLVLLLLLVLTILDALTQDQVITSKREEDLNLKIGKYPNSIGLIKNAYITQLFDSINSLYFNNKTAIDWKKRFSCKSGTVFKPDWGKYVGKHRVINNGMDQKWYAKISQLLGLGYQKIKIEKVAQSLRISGWSGESVRRESEPGLFFLIDNEALDFRSDKPTCRNVMIHKK